MTKVKLGEVADILSGYAFKSTQFNTEKRGLPLIRIRDVERGFSDTYFEGDFAEEYLVHNGDLLITMDGSFILKKWAGGEALLNQRVCKLIIRDNRVEEDYISWIVPKYLKEIEDKTPFVTVKHLSVAKIHEISFELPHRSEQLVISNQLNNIKDIYNLRLQQLSKLSDLVKSRFYEMFGDPQNNPKLIPTKFLGEVCTVERGGSPRPIAEFITDSNDGINWIKIGDTDGTRYISTTAEKIIPEGVKKSRMVKAGDLILSNSMSFGHPYIVKIDGCIHDGWLVLHFDTMIFDAVYLQTYLGLPVVYTIFKTMAVGGVVNNLNSKIVKELPILVPDIKQQNQFADFVAEVDKSQLAIKKSLEELETLKKSLMQAYFG